MKAKLDSGKVMEFKVGQALTGHRFLNVTFDMRDACKEGFVEYIRDVVQLRLCPTWELPRDKEVA